MESSNTKFPFTLIAGPCVIENENITKDIAKNIKDICNDLDINFIFKSSFDKANRSSSKSYRGPGFEEGLNILKDIKENLGLKILTDIHESNQAFEVSKLLM